MRARLHVADTERNETPVEAQSRAPLFGFMMNRALAKLSLYAPACGDQIYHLVDKNHVEFTNLRWWTEGFWTGLLWLAHEYSGDQKYADIARASKHRFKARLANKPTHDHDMGFLYSLSSVAEYVITGDVDGRYMGLEAARSLASRFNPKGQFIQAWNSRPDQPVEWQRELKGKAIIDCMMNLPLLWWASQETGDPYYGEVAHAHARTSRKYFFRENGSTCHTFNFDPETGEAIGPKTAQGYADSSAWSRGNAWALYGYALAYACTGEKEYLDIARFSADFWLKACPANGVPPWDFDAPGQNEPVDTSAAAIAACGLFEIARHLGEEEGARYRDFAEKALITLNEQYFQPDAYMGLIGEAVSNRNVNYGVRVHLVYSDYFYLEALFRAQGRHRFYWIPNPVV